MNTAVGILLLAVGTLIVCVALALIVSEIISGRHGTGASTAATMAGVDWTGMGAVLKGFAAIFKALAKWPLPALLVLLGLAFDVLGVWILTTKPI